MTDRDIYFLKMMVSKEGRCKDVDGIQCFSNCPIKNYCDRVCDDYPGINAIELPERFLKYSKKVLILEKCTQKKK